MSRDAVSSPHKWRLGPLRQLWLAWPLLYACSIGIASGQQAVVFDNPCVAGAMPEPAIPDDIVAFPSQNSDAASPQGVLDHIRMVMRVQRSIPVYEMGLENACARKVKGKPVILVNKAWLDSLAKKSKWAPQMILAHELGHHINAHDTKEDGLMPWDREEQADHYAGGVLRVLGASRNDVHEAVQVYPLENRGNHPNRSQRYIALMYGFTGNWDGLEPSDTPSLAINDPDEISASLPSGPNNSFLSNYVDNLNVTEQSLNDVNAAKELNRVLADANVWSVSAIEFLQSGSGNIDRSNKCYGLNEIPPKKTWPSLIKLGEIVDKLTERLKQKIVIVSGSRTILYATCLNSSSYSAHTSGKALDIRAENISPLQIAETLCKLRKEKVFSGGIGLYDKFVHFDISNWNKDWATGAAKDSWSCTPLYISSMSDPEFQNRVKSVKTVAAGMKIDELVPDKQYDVILQVGHYPRKAGSIGGQGLHVSEQEISAAIAVGISTYLRDRGMIVAIIGADSKPASRVKTRIFLALHADSGVEKCSVGASYGYSRNSAGHKMQSVATALAMSLEYEPSEFREKNFAPAIQSYYAYKWFDSEILSGVVEMAEVTCPAQEENVISKSGDLAKNLATAIEFQIKSGS
jgi:Peptidase M15/N-acetylmuramoyl-L-alanine amidase